MRNIIRCTYAQRLTMSFFLLFQEVDLVRRKKHSHKKKGKKGPKNQQPGDDGQTGELIN